MATKPNPVLKLQLGKELSVQNCFLVPYNTYIEYTSKPAVLKKHVTIF